MKRILFPVLAAAAIFLSAFKIYNAPDWQIAGGYSVHFAGKDAEGIFNKMTGAVSFDENDLASSKFSISIEVASIATGNGIKNRQAKSERWFDAEKYPVINFTSDRISKTDLGYSADGTLEMHGTKKEITVPFTFSNNTFKSSFSVNRLDYGVGTMQGMQKKVSDEIRLDIAVPVTKK